MRKTRAYSFLKLYTFPMRILLFSFVLLHSSLLWASRGKVLRLRGKVYAAYPHIKGKKQILRKGSVIKGNALITSKGKSFAKIKLQDGSVIFVGPRSKIALSHKNPTKPPFVELVNGKIRAVVNKHAPFKKGYDHKMYIQTRSSSIGVRGTDLYLSYNDKNHITSNVTLRGEVAMYKKTDEDIYESIREEFDGKRVIRFGQDVHNDMTEDHLKHRYTKSIKQGEFSGSFPSYEKPLKPVHISLQQLNALASSENMGTGPRGKVIRGKYKLSQVSKRNSYLIPKPYNETISQDNHKENIDQYTGTKPGGHVDLASGIYISPPENAKRDPSTGLYEMPEGLGGIDANSGEYIPPDGVIMDPIKGFIANPKQYGDRNIKENLSKLINLSGGINDKLTGALKIFKEITRSDFFAQVNYNYTTRVTEMYYGEHREITDAPSMLWDMKGFYGFQLFHNKRYLWYAKGSLSALYHERTLPEVKRNNTYTGVLGVEFHRKHVLNNKKARFIADVEFTTSYMDYRKRNLFDFYTENAAIRLSETFQFNRYNLSEIYWQLKAFQGYEDRNHGNIHHAGITHRFIFQNAWDFMLGYDYNQRREKMVRDHYTIRNGFFKIIRKDLIFRTDFSMEYSFQAHNSKNNVRFDKATYNKIQLELNKRLEEFWKLNGTYSYERQKAEREVVRSSFIKQTWGGGLVMVF